MALKKWSLHAPEVAMVRDRDIDLAVGRRKAFDHIVDSVDARLEPRHQDLRTSSPILILSTSPPLMYVDGLNSRKQARPEAEPVGTGDDAIAHVALERAKRDDDLGPLRA